MARPRRGGTGDGVTNEPGSDTDIGLRLGRFESELQHRATKVDIANVQTEMANVRKEIADVRTQVERTKTWALERMWAAIIAAAMVGAGVAGVLVRFID